MGQKSKLDKMPEAVRTLLDGLLKNKALTQLEITARLNEALQAMGEPAIGKSTVNRYAMTFRDVMAKREESTLVVKQWVGRMGDIPDGDYGRAMVEILRTLAFDLSIAASNNGKGDDLPGTVKMVKDLATMVEKVERAATLNEKRVIEIERNAAAKAKQQAADAVGQAAKQMGLSAEQVSFWRDQVLLGA